MPFPVGYKERIYADICAEGCRRDFVVVPEFKLRYHRDGRLAGKWADIVWFSSSHEKKKANKSFRVLAAFEIDGFDVPLETIDFYSRIYPLVRTYENSEFPCYVPLYTNATHRSGYGDNLSVVASAIALRVERAAQHRNQRTDRSPIIVCDGSQPHWFEDVLVGEPLQG